MVISSTTASHDPHGPISRLLRSFVEGNPLLAHGPRTHATGVQLSRPATPDRPVRRRSAPLPIASRVHLGRAGRV